MTAQTKGATNAIGSTNDVASGEDPTGDFTVISLLKQIVINTTPA